MSISQGQQLYIVKNMGVKVVELGYFQVTKIGNKYIHVEISRYKTIKLSIDSLMEKTDYGCWHTAYLSQSDYENQSESAKLREELNKKFRDLQGKLSINQVKQILDILN